MRIEARNSTNRISYCTYNDTLNPGSLLFRYFSHRTVTSQITWKSEPDSLQRKEMCVFSQHPDHQLDSYSLLSSGKQGLLQWA